MMTMIIQNFMMFMSAMLFNPMKMSMMMIISSMVMFLNIFNKTGKSWMPTSMVMLFMGGILMMFMMLSSTMPNEKMKSSKSKMKLTKTTMLVLMVMTMSWLVLSEGSSEQLQQMKFFINNAMSMPFMISLMMTYFSIFMFLMKGNKNSLRAID